MMRLLLLLLLFPLFVGCGDPASPTGTNNPTGPNNPTDSNNSGNPLVPPFSLDENVTGRIFYTERDSAGSSSICMIRPDGSGYVRIVKGATLLARPAGGRMLYITEGNDPRIMAARINGTDPRVIHEGRAKGELAPNGRIAACIEPGKIVLVDIETGSRRVVNETISGNTVGFSPDSRYVAVGSGDLLRIVDVATGTTHRAITHPHISSPYTEGIDACSWSPTGERFLVTTKHRTATGERENALFIIDTAGENLSFLDSQVGAFAWSPDGKNVALKHVGQLLQLWVYDGTTLNLVCYSSLTPETSVDWSADGKDVLFTFSDGLGNEFLGTARAVVGGTASPLAARGYGAYSVR
jgi:Tol biopolymer transport system component